MNMPLKTKCKNLYCAFRIKIKIKFPVQGLLLKYSWIGPAY